MEGLAFFGGAVYELMLTWPPYLHFPEKPLASLFQQRNALLAQSSFIAAVARLLGVTDPGADVPHSLSPFSSSDSSVSSSSSFQERFEADDPWKPLVQRFLAQLALTFVRKGYAACELLFARAALFPGAFGAPLAERWCLKRDLNRYDLVAKMAPPGYQEMLERHLRVEMGIPVKQLGLYAQAFCHPSFSKSALADYQRLEYLGDAVLEVFARLHIFRSHPLLPRGALRDIRNVLVANTTLASVATKCGFVKLVLRAPTFVISETMKLVADVFESFIAALFLDLGASFVEVFLDATLFKETAAIVERKAWIGPRAQLLAFLMGLDPRFQPSYHEEEVSRHPPSYAAEVRVYSCLIARVVQPEKKMALDAVAEEALAKLSTPMALVDFPFMKKARNHNRLWAGVSVGEVHTRSGKNQKGRVRY
ncbi:MAG: ribonuclease III domain-containing protein [archaeon]|nr:ribonuclease III domain-containing protein [archaeon]